MIDAFDISLFIIIFVCTAFFLESWKQRLNLFLIALCVAWTGMLLSHAYYLSSICLLLLSIALTVQIEFLINKNIKSRFKNYFRSTPNYSNSLTERPIDLLNPEIRSVLKHAATQKLGLLIVIEKSDPIFEYCQNIQPLEADLNKDLILAIFTPPGPLHDGALLVRNNKIVGAGAVLPISNSNQEQTGTRHLAALGLSEHCDAEVWIVSEESGQIKRAHKGTLESIQRF
jgi:DNA integrity scanning protein DisA with diadenylate cyclase activity